MPIRQPLTITQCFVRVDLKKWQRSNASLVSMHIFTRRQVKLRRRIRSANRDAAARSTNGHQLTTAPCLTISPSSDSSESRSAMSWKERSQDSWLIAHLKTSGKGWQRSNAMSLCLKTPKTSGSTWLIGRNGSEIDTVQGPSQSKSFLTFLKGLRRRTDTSTSTKCNSCRKRKPKDWSEVQRVWSVDAVIWLHSLLNTKL